MFRVADRLHCTPQEAASAPLYWRQAALMAISAENGAAAEKQRAAERKARAARKMGGPLTVPVTASELQVVVSADTKPAESSLSTFSGKLGSVGSTMAKVFGGVALAGIAAVGAGLAASTVSAAGFEKQMSAIKAVSGATGDEMRQLGSLAMQLGADTSFSAAEAAQGIEELIKAGVSVGDVMGGAAAASLNLAAAGAVSVSDAAEIAANAMNQFGLKGTDLAHVADLIAGAANASAIDVNDFKFSLAAVGAVANTVGFSFDDTATAIAMLGQAGIKGSDAGTSLKTMFMSLQPQTDKQTALFRQLGLVTADGANQFFDASGKVKSMADVAGTLQTALKGMTQQQKLATLETIFGSDAIRAAAVFANEGSEGFNQMAESMGKVTAEAVAQERLNNLAGFWEQLTGSLETAAITVGSALTPSLKELVKWMGDGVSGAMPALQDFAVWVDGEFSAVIISARDSGRQLLDAWGTVKQVFGEGWSADASIEPIALAAGNAATAVKRLADFVTEAANKAANMGAWQNLERGLGTLRDTANSIPARLGEIAESLDRLNGASGGASTKVDALAGGLKVVSTAFELWSVSMKIAVDTSLLVGETAMNMLSVLANVGRAVYALATGDMPSFNNAVNGAADALTDMIGDALRWQQSTETAVRQGARAIGVNISEQTAVAQLVGSANMQQLANAVESNMSAANQAVGVNSSGMAQFMEANGATMVMAAETSAVGVVTAVEGQAGPMAAAATTVGTAATDGIASQAPAMAAAAGEGAASAVAAVEGQTGAASGAGQSLGQALGSGLEGGILAYAGRVAAAAANLVRSAIGAAQAEGEIESPSKRTMYLGQMLDEGLIKGIESLSPDVQRAMQDLIQGVTDYAPVAREVARVEREIKNIREAAQTDALFRGEDMITIESELLRLKRDQVDEERRLLPIRQDLAAAEREVSRISAGSLQDRSALLENDAQRKALRLQTLDLEKQLVGLDRDSKRAEGIERQIEKLRDQDRLLGIEAEKIRTTNDLAATAERRRVLGLGEILAAEEKNIDAIGREITKLGAEEAVFRANEAIIKNATDNEIAYRQRLIAVFNAEGKPLADRITAGLALVDQLEGEGKISKELADKLREVGKQAGFGAEASKGLGSAAQGAAPQLDAAAQKAKEMADQAKRIAEQADKADSEVSALAKSLGKLPSWFTPKGSNSSLFGGGKAEGGSVARNTTYLVGERGPELFTPSQSGSITPNHLIGQPAAPSGGSRQESIRVDIAISGRVAEQIVIDGYDLAVRRGWTPAGLTG